MKPAISIVIPAYNVADTIERCITSALSQSGLAGPVQVIVVDNLCKDETRRLAEKFPVTIVTETTPGHAAARNCGAREAAADFIAFFDADCVAPHDWISSALAVMDRPWIGASQARIRRHGQPPAPRLFLQGYYHAPFLSTQSLVVRREAFEQAGGFDPKMRRNVDIDFTFRVIARGYALAWLPEPVVVTYHYMPRARAWRRGLEAGKAGSQLENKWQALVGHKPRSLRYRDRVLAISKSVARSLLDADSPSHLVLLEQLGRLVSYAWTEAFAVELALPLPEPVVAVPSVLGERRFLILTDEGALIFDANAGESRSIDRDALATLKAQIDRASIGKAPLMTSERQ